MIAHCEGTSPESTQPSRLKITVAAAFPLVALVLLWATNTPLGQPHLIYRYSPWWVLRAITAIPALVIGLTSAWLLFLCFEGRHRDRRHTLAAASLVGYGLLVAWTLIAPPYYVEQHVFNLESPSHEGAFVLEARKHPDLSNYVSKTFYESLTLEPEDIKGRRVLSNPPGPTVVAGLCDRLLESSPALRNWIVRTFDLAGAEDPLKERHFAVSMFLVIMFTSCWGASLVFAFLLSRLFLPKMASATIAFACVFNPATVAFTPGKDPAQLLTVLAILWAWLASYTRRSAVHGAIAGVVFGVALTMGLIHVWILAIVAGGTLLHVLTCERNFIPWLSKTALPSLGGFLAVTVAMYLVFNWNILLMTWKIGLRYGQIQENVITSPFFWTLIGLPMFLLFVGPTFWVQLLAHRDNQEDSSAKLGRCLLAVAAVALTYTYFTANNNETPRLWMPFIPLLLLGMSLRRSVFRTDSHSQRYLCLILICLQLGVTLAHWSLMDVRESEYRLTTGRMFE